MNKLNILENLLMIKIKLNKLKYEDKIDSTDIMELVLKVEKEIGEAE